MYCVYAHANSHTSIRFFSSLLFSTTYTRNRSQHCTSTKTLIIITNRVRTSGIKVWKRKKKGVNGKETKRAKKHDIQNAAEKRALNSNTVHSRTYTTNIWIKYMHACVRIHTESIQILLVGLWSVAKTASKCMRTRANIRGKKAQNDRNAIRAMLESNA